MQTLIILAFGIIIGFGFAMVMRTKTDKDMQFVGHLMEKKQGRLQRLLEHFEKNSRVTNDDVEGLLGVSNTTAYRYLEELQRKGKIRQVGRTGVGVFYEKR